MRIISRFTPADREELSARLGEPPAISVLAIAKGYQMHGENLFDTLERLALHEALLLHGGSQEHAAVELGTYPVLINRRLKNYDAMRKQIRAVEDTA